MQNNSSSKRIRLGAFLYCKILFRVIIYSTEKHTFHEKIITKPRKLQRLEPMSSGRCSFLYVSTSDNVYYEKEI